MLQSHWPSPIRVIQQDAGEADSGCGRNLRVCCWINCGNKACWHLSINICYVCIPNYVYVIVCRHNSRVQCCDTENNKFMHYLWVLWTVECQSCCFQCFLYIFIWIRLKTTNTALSLSFIRQWKPKVSDNMLIHISISWVSSLSSDKEIPTMLCIL